MAVLPGPENPGKWVKIAPKVLGHTPAFADLDIVYYKFISNPSGMSPL